MKTIKKLNLFLFINLLILALPNIFSAAEKKDELYDKEYALELQRFIKGLSSEERSFLQKLSPEEKQLFDITIQNHKNYARLEDLGIVSDKQYEETTKRLDAIMLDLVNKMKDLDKFDTISILADKFMMLRRATKGLNLKNEEI